MDRFAVVLQPDGGKRVIENHHILKRLPKKAAMKCMSYLSAQKTGLVMDKENQEELGCLIDMPGFFLDWKLKGEDDRLKHLKKLVQRLKKWNCPILGFAQIHHYLNEEECSLLKNSGLILLDGFRHRLAGLLLVAKQLLCIVEKDIPHFEIGVWGADTDIGRVWVEHLAGRVNLMCIGGRNYRELEELADFILRSTGLACQITIKPEVCLGNKDLTVIADTIDDSFRMRQTGLHINSIPEQKLSYLYSIDNIDLKRDVDQWHSIDMAWMNLPEVIEVDQELNLSDKLGVIDALFYTISSVYREDILKRRTTLELIKQLHSLYELIDLRPLGFNKGGQPIHYDRFRREYFADKLSIICENVT